MNRAVIVGGFLVLVLAMAGCLGAGGDGGTEQVTDEVDEQATGGGEASSDAELAGASSEACEGVRENATALLAAKDEAPFGDREPLEPQLHACGDAGVFLIAAHGLEGPMAVQMTWSFPEPASCQAYEAAAATGGHHRFVVDGWDHAQAEPSVGVGSGGGGSEVFIGPADSQELASEGNGKTAWGGSTELNLAAGEHSFVQATNGWGPWDTALTEGAALLQILVCDAPFSLEAIETTSTLHLFSHHDLEQGAGARAPLFTGASTGQALDVELEEEARLRVGGFALAGAGAVQVAHAEADERYPFGPEERLRLVEEIPEGPLTITAARAGVTSILAGAAYGGMSPVPAEDIVG